MKINRMKTAAIRSAIARAVEARPGIRTGRRRRQTDPIRCGHGAECAYVRHLLAELAERGEVRGSISMEVFGRMLQLGVSVEGVAE